MKITVIIIIFLIKSVFNLDFRYHDHQTMVNIMKKISSNNRYLQTNLYLIGKSVKGKDLWVLSVSAADPADILVPNIKLIGGIHGNRPPGREILLHFLEYLSDNYKTNKTIQHLLNHTRIHVLPSMNPDGFENSISDPDNTKGYENANSINLNENFSRKPGLIQPETRAIMDWIERTPFVLSASFSGSYQKIIYPFNEPRIIPGSHFRTTMTPDVDVFIDLTKTYSLANPMIGQSCADDDYFEDPEPKVHSVPDSMQDYNYMAGILELNIFISCVGRPLNLKELWLENRDSLLLFSMKSLQGVTGRIIDNRTKMGVENVKLLIEKNQVNMPFYSRKNGVFWRLLLPGLYLLKIEAEGYATIRKEFVVKYGDEMGLNERLLTKLDVYLDKNLEQTIKNPEIKTTTTTEKIEAFASTINGGTTLISKRYPIILIALLIINLINCR